MDMADRLGPPHPVAIPLFSQVRATMLVTVSVFLI